MKIPAQYLPVMPYLVLNNAEGFLEFAKNVFGASEQMIVPAPDHGIMHGELRIGDAVIMFADAGGEWKPKTASMYLYVENVDTVHQKAIEARATSLQDPQQKEYGYTSGFEDPFGNHWFIVEPAKE